MSITQRSGKKTVWMGTTYEKGRLMEYRSVGRDITKHKYIEEEVNRSYQTQTILNKLLCVFLKNLLLEKMLEQLEVKTNNLEDVNATLRVLLKKRDEDKNTPYITLFEVLQ